MTDRLIRITTAIAVMAVALVAAVISYQHAYELVCSPGESGLTARLVPFTVDGLIWAAFMVVLDASRRGQPVPRLAAWSLGACATVGANLGARGGAGAGRRAGQRLARTGTGRLIRATDAAEAGCEARHQAEPPLAHEAPLELPAAPTLEQTIRARHEAGRSQRAIAREFNIDRRKVKRVLDQAA
ncbi:MAG: DUF2637 domain-containing protein [Actinobacteria bacterium]|nr:DUF2637 domain-containing protein [Actinomycetota bacterium]